MLNWLFSAGEEEEFDKALRSLSEWLLLLLRTARGPLGGALEGRLFRSCKSWVHSALTLPAEGLGDDLAEEVPRYIDIRE
jgi:hypothetical protein